MRRKDFFGRAVSLSGALQMPSNIHALVQDTGDGNRLVEDRAIGEELRLAPGFKGVLQNIGKIVLRARRKDQQPFRA